jgi:hypothetical protein
MPETPERDLAYAMQEYSACWAAKPITPEQVSRARAEVLAAAEVYRLADWLDQQGALDEQMPF